MQNGLILIWNFLPYRNEWWYFTDLRTSENTNIMHQIGKFLVFWLKTCKICYLKTVIGKFLKEQSLLLFHISGSIIRYSCFTLDVFNTIKFHDLTCPSSFSWGQNFHNFYPSSLWNAEWALRNQDFPSLY